MEIFIDGMNLNREINPCMCCENYINIYTNGICMEDDKDVLSGYTCDKFKRNIHVFDDNNDFLNDDVRNEYYS